MSESGKRIFASAGISSSLDTVLATTLGTNYHTNRLKKSNPNLISEKSLSNNSSKSSSGSSLTLTNNLNNVNSTTTNNITNSQQFPHHQFYQTQISQISTSSNWNSNLNIRSNSICSQKVSSWSEKSSQIVVLGSCDFNSYEILLALIACVNKIACFIHRRKTNQHPCRWLSAIEWCRWEKSRATDTFENHFAIIWEDEINT